MWVTANVPVSLNLCEHAERLRALLSVRSLASGGTERVPPVLTATAKGASYSDLAATLRAFVKLCACPTKATSCSSLPGVG